MNFLFPLVSLVCANLYFCRAGTTSANQACATTSNPTNIHVHCDGDVKGSKGEKGDAGGKGDQGQACSCLLQDARKPSAHIGAAELRKTVTYQAHAVIKDWSLNASYSHITGGMKYKDGTLTVPVSGRYYVYAQIWHDNINLKWGRVFIRVNGNIVTMTNLLGKVGANPIYTGAVFNLKAGDVISLTAFQKAIKIWMASNHTYFGAYLI